VEGDELSVDARGAQLGPLLLQVAEKVEFETLMVSAEAQNQLVTVSFQELPIREGLLKILEAADLNHVVWGGEGAPFRVFAGPADDAVPLQSVPRGREDDYPGEARRPPATTGEARPPGPAGPSGPAATERRRNDGRAPQTPPGFLMPGGLPGRPIPRDPNPRDPNPRVPEGSPPQPEAIPAEPEGMPPVEEIPPEYEAIPDEPDVMPPWEETPPEYEEIPEPDEIPPWEETPPWDAEQPQRGSRWVTDEAFLAERPDPTRVAGIWSFLILGLAAGVPMIGRRSDAAQEDQR